MRPSSQSNMNTDLSSIKRRAGLRTDNDWWKMFLVHSAALLFAVFLAGPLVAQSLPVATLVKSARLLDPKTGNVLSPAAVLIENGKIQEVGSSAQLQAHVPPGAKTIDLGSATLLPGLIDAHTHLLLDVIVPPVAESGRRYNGDFVPDLLLAIVESPSKRVVLPTSHAAKPRRQCFPVCMMPECRRSTSFERSPPTPRKCSDGRIALGQLSREDLQTSLQSWATRSSTLPNWSEFDL
jgi:hypothetical protein